jgi:hypothetical protein
VVIRQACRHAATCRETRSYLFKGDPQKVGLFRRPSIAFRSHESVLASRSKRNFHGYRDRGWVHAALSLKPDPILEFRMIYLGLITLVKYKLQVIKISLFMRDLQPLSARSKPILNLRLYECALALPRSAINRVEWLSN